MENQPQSLFSSFFSGAIKSGASGALMSSIFYGLGLATGFVKIAAGATFLSTVIGPIALMAASVAVFGGIMAVKRTMDQAHHNPQHGLTHSRTREVDTMTPVLAQEATLAQTASIPTQSWTERTGSTERSDRVQQILADGALSDKSRASAILAERQASVAAEQAR